MSTSWYVTNGVEVPLTNLCDGRLTKYNVEAAMVRPLQHAGVEYIQCVLTHTAHDAAVVCRAQEEGIFYVVDIWGHIHGTGNKNTDHLTEIFRALEAEFGLQWTPEWEMPPEWEMQWELRGDNQDEK